VAKGFVFARGWKAEVVEGVAWSSAAAKCCLPLTSWRPDVVEGLTRLFAALVWSWAAGIRDVAVRDLDLSLTL